MRAATTCAKNYSNNHLREATMFKYLHDGTYHTDTSDEYMGALGLDDDAKQSVLTQKEYEESQQPSPIELFKTERQKLIDNAKVTIASGKSFDADETSITRLANALIKHWDLEPTGIIPWSTAEVGAGEMVDCTKAEIIEAHQLATDNFAATWQIPD